MTDSNIRYMFSLSNNEVIINNYVERNNGFILQHDIYSVNKINKNVYVLLTNGTIVNVFDDEDILTIENYKGIGKNEFVDKIGYVSIHEAITSDIPVDNADGYVFKKYRMNVYVYSKLLYLYTMYKYDYHKFVELFKGLMEFFIKHYNEYGVNTFLNYDELIYNISNDDYRSGWDSLSSGLSKIDAEWNHILSSEVDKLLHIQNEAIEIMLNVNNDLNKDDQERFDVFYNLIVNEYCSRLALTMSHRFNLDLDHVLSIFKHYNIDIINQINEDIKGDLMKKYIR